MRYVINICIVIFFLLGCSSKLSENKVQPNDEKTPLKEKQDLSAKQNQVISENTNQDSNNDKEAIQLKKLDSSIMNMSEGSIIETSGQFWGWQAKKAGCQNLGNPPVSRNDWILKVENSMCFYVTGKIPAGVEITKPNGELLKLKLIVHYQSDGTMYFENAVETGEKGEK